MPKIPKILLSAGMIQKGQSGVGRYVVELAQRLSSFPEIDLHIVGMDADRGLFPTIDPGNWVTIPPRYASGVLNLVWHQLFLPRVIKQGSFDLLHIPSYRRIIACSPAPQVVTVHDCAPFRLRDKYGPLRGIFGRKVAPFLAKRCDKILTVSAFTKGDIVQFYGIAEEEVEVIHNGLDHTTYKPAALDALESFRNRKSIKGPFYLYISRLEHPGKNHLALIKAFEQLRREDAGEIQLVLGGARWHGAEVIEAAVKCSEFRESIHLVGFVEEADLPLWYASAEALVFPSLFEGFGLPVAEAMACGTNVLCSDRASLPEVGGAAAIYFSPESVDSIVAAMRKLSAEGAEAKAERQNLVAEQASRFDWNRVANSTCKAYLSTLKMPTI
jgi:glycosyltransferase involved in cell wall biosynthesis